MDQYQDGETLLRSSIKSASAHATLQVVYSVLFRAAFCLLLCFCYMAYAKGLVSAWDATFSTSWVSAVFFIFDNSRIDAAMLFEYI